MIAGEVDETTRVDETAKARHDVAMRLLNAGVPLSLLFDLALPEGPDSEAILIEDRAGIPV